MLVKYLHSNNRLRTSKLNKGNIHFNLEVTTITVKEKYHSGYLMRHAKRENWRRDLAAIHSAKLKLAAEIFTKLKSKFPKRRNDNRTKIDKHM